MPNSNRAFPVSSLSSNPTSERPKSLGLHESKIASEPEATRAPAPVSKRNKRELDSANFEAARELLQAREDADLTQEQIAARSGSDVSTVARRERNEVDLGALRQLVLLKRAKEAKGSK